MSIKIRLLTESDVQEVLTFQRPEGWNQNENDWRRLLRLEPEGCFAAVSEGRIVATVTTLTYGRDLAWIGMMLVAREYRRRGIGSQLFSQAMDYLRAAGIAVIKLDATPAGEPLYESFAFSPEGLIERWETVSTADLVARTATFDPETRQKIYSMDRHVFGADRARLLDALITNSPITPLAVTAAGGKIKGYALARPGLYACHVGPVTAQDESTALHLLDTMLGQLKGQRVYLDLHTGCGADRNELLKRGFVLQRPFLRMRSGNGKIPGTSPLVFAIAGPEAG